MRLLKDELYNFVRRKGFKRGIEAAVIINATKQVLEDVLPRTLIGDVKIESYYDGLLKLRVPTGSALSAVHMYRQELLFALKKRLGQAKVERILVLPQKSYLSQ